MTTSLLFNLLHQSQRLVLSYFPRNVANDIGRNKRNNFIIYVTVTYTSRQQPLYQSVSHDHLNNFVVGYQMKPRHEIAKNAKTGLGQCRS
jgi:hypothetical protein